MAHAIEIYMETRHIYAEMLCNSKNNNNLKGLFGSKGFCRTITYATAPFSFLLSATVL
jgi:hypothetical protein